VAVLTAFQVYVGVGLLIVPEGEIRVAAAGVAVTVKGSPLLHGPYPAELQVWIHHRAAPAARTVGGVTEHVPVPVPQPAADAEYQPVILGEALESCTHR